MTPLRIFYIFIAWIVSILICAIISIAIGDGLGGHEFVVISSGTFCGAALMAILLSLRRRSNDQ